ncbi:MAG: hypothetical protein M3P49_02625 [Actinomycetota bacterium]|nr:hypothetical protein [Actinomycetota bacterium]
MAERETETTDREAWLDRARVLKSLERELEDEDTGYTTSVSGDAEPSPDGLRCMYVEIVKLGDFMVAYQYVGATDEEWVIGSVVDAVDVVMDSRRHEIWLEEQHNEFADNEGIPRDFVPQEILDAIYRPRIGGQ